jgi:hypothetical protein
LPVREPLRAVFGPGEDRNDVMTMLDNPTVEGCARSSDRARIAVFGPGEQATPAVWAAIMSRGGALTSARFDMGLCGALPSTSPPRVRNNLSEVGQRPTPSRVKLAAGCGYSVAVALVAGVHGVFWNWRSRQEMETAWRQAVSTGLDNRRLSHLSDYTFEAAFYGDYYNDGKGAGAGSSVLDVEPGLETEMLLAMAESIDSSPAGTGTEQAKVALPSTVQAALTLLVRTTYFGQATEEMVVSRVKQVRRYFDDPELRARIHAELAAAIAPDTRVLIGHSLGSLVAYEGLRANPDWPVRTLITLGSPLGLPAIQRRLWPPLTADDRWAGSVKHWINIAARQDAIAMVKQLKTVIHPDIDDRLCSNPRLRAHHAGWYLSNEQFVGAFADALG